MTWKRNIRNEKRLCNLWGTGGQGDRGTGGGDKGEYRKGRTLGKEKVGNDPDSLTLIASSLFRFFQIPFFSNVRWKDGTSPLKQAVFQPYSIRQFNMLKLMYYHGYVESLTDEVL
jgi:hypothetical protein